MSTDEEEIPTLPSLPVLPTLPTLPVLPTLPSVPSIPALPVLHINPLNTSETAVLPSLPIIPIDRILPVSAITVSKQSVLPQTTQKRTKSPHVSLKEEHEPPVEIEKPLQIDINLIPQMTFLSTKELVFALDPFHDFSVFRARPGNSFTHLKTLSGPTDRKLFSATFFGKRLLMAGGSCPKFDFWSFDLRSLLWCCHSLVGPPLPKLERHKMACVPFRDRVLSFLFGGVLDGKPFNNVLACVVGETTCGHKILEFDIAVKPEARIGHSMTTFEGKKIFILGGKSLRDDRILNDFWLLDLMANLLHPKFARLPTPPFQPRYDHYCFEKDEFFYVSGGFNQMGDFLNEIWRYKDSYWERVGSFLPPPSHFFYASSFGFFDLSEKVENLMESEPKISFDRLIQKRDQFLKHQYAKEKAIEEIEQTDPHFCVLEDPESVNRSQVELCDELKIALNVFSDYNVSSNQHEYHLTQLYHKIERKMTHRQREFQQKRSDLTKEIEYGLVQKDELSTRCWYSTSKKLDTSDIKSFKIFSEGFDNLHVEKSLISYYAMQLRDHEVNRKKLANLEKKVAASYQIQQNYNRKFTQIGREYETNELKKEELETSLKQWQLATENEQQIQKEVDLFLQQMKEYSEHPNDAPNGTEDVEGSIQAQMGEICGELEDLLPYNRKFARLADMTRTLKKQFKEWPIENARLSAKSMTSDFTTFLSDLPTQ